MATSVLIVDDHPSFRATARLLLEIEGYEVIGEAPDGLTAIERVRELDPDVVLLDVNLPDIDGFDVATRVSKQSNGSGRPTIVMCSSRDSSDFGPLVARSGARGFISKADLSGASLAAVLAG